MPTAKQCSDHKWVMTQLKAAQEADHDNREMARESALFVSKRDGQWEPYWWDRADGKPRYTFDLTNPIIDQVTGAMEKADFDIKVLPMGGDASKDTAKVYDGLVRNIEAISNASQVYAQAGRSMSVKGLDGWRVVQEYVGSDSFDQDLMIVKIPNFLDHVWFGPHNEPDASDAQFGWVLAGLSPEEFKEKYPDRSESASIEGDKTGNAYYHRQDLVMIGEFLYLKEVSRELVQMTNGKVYEVDDDFKAVQDELAMLGITEQARRMRKSMVVWTRKFDTDGWITEAEKTVFENWIPVVPCYGNFDYLEDKVIYYGAVEKLIDPQRVFNYSLSREIEEGALAPRAKYWMTRKQAEGEEVSLSTMNTNADPVQFFTPDEELPGPPQQSGGATINPGLRNISDAMQNIVGMTAGMFAANMGENPGLQSGKAIEALQDRGDTGSNKYIAAREISQQHTGRILVNAIPRVYLPGRQVRILQDDGSFDMDTIGQKVPDMQTQTVRVLNDLTEGTYDVTCTSGPSFQNRQSETVTAITEVGQIDPTVIELGGDILLGNISSPGMDQLAERKRKQLFQAGLIPDDQMTDEEQQQKQALAQQPPQESPEMVLAKAEEAKAQSDMVDSQTRQMETQATLDVKTKELQIRAFEAETKRFQAEVEKAVAMGAIKGSGAKAAKDLAEAEAQDIENDAVASGITELMGKVEGVQQSG